MPGQGLNLIPLPGSEESQLLDHQGSPIRCLLFHLTVNVEVGGFDSLTMLSRTQIFSTSHFVILGISLSLSLIQDGGYSHHCVLT